MDVKADDEQEKNKEENFSVNLPFCGATTSTSVQRCVWIQSGVVGL